MSLYVLGWEKSSYNRELLYMITENWYEDPFHGDESPLLYWDGDSLWATDAWEPLSVNDLNEMLKYSEMY
jgi:hypothetical protein